MPDSRTHSELTLVSIRRNFDSGLFFGPETWCNANLMDGTRPGRLCEYTWTGAWTGDERTALDWIRAHWAGVKKVLILVHGYNSNVVKSRRAFEEICWKLPVEYDAVLGYLWPGSNTVLGYWTAWMRARRAGERLADLMHRLRFAGVERIDLNAHSMGCAVALKAMCLEQAELAVLNGPAVDRGALAPGGEFEKAAEHFLHCIISWSRTDPALGIAGVLARWKEAPMGGMGPLFGASPPSSIQVLDLTGQVIEHGGYRSNLQILEAWRTAAVLEER